PGRHAAEAGRRFRRLAALPIRSAPDSKRRGAAASRLRAAEDEGRGLPTQRVAVPDGRARRSGALQGFRDRIAGRGGTPLFRVSTALRDQGAGVRSHAGARGSCRQDGRQGGVMDLSTTYLGKRLPHPLIVGAGPLGDDLDIVKALEDNGAAMLVLRSLFEEEITGEQMDAFFYLDGHNDSFSEAGSFEPEPETPLGPD